MAENLEESPRPGSTEPSVDQNPPAEVFVEPEVPFKPESSRLQSEDDLGGWPPIVRALRNPDFRIFWSGNFLSNIGTWMQNVALGWLILELTESSFWLGMVGFAASFPFLIFTLFGGVIADRVNKRYLLVGTQTIMMILAFLLAALAYFKIITIRSLIVIAFLNGMVMSLNAPSYQAMVPQLVRSSDLPNAVALNSAQFNMSRVVGPTLGGYAMAFFGVAGNFFLNGVSFLAVLASLFRIHYPETKPGDGLTMWQSLKEGFAYVRANAQMWAIIGLVGTVSFFVVPFLTFIPFFARNILHTSARGLGILMACSGLGAFFAAVTIAYFGKLRHRGAVIVASGLFVMASVIGFCYSHSFVLSAFLQMCEGYGLILTVSTVNVSMQQLSSSEMRGRVMSIYSTSYLGLPPVGALIAGAFSKYLPTTHVLAAMSGLAMLVYILYYMTSAPLRELD
ncbi:MAG TPA: MFS transporter [Acidisarcina sp.]|nr:MFS transporter [Acidisarcina sp.]